MKLIPRFFLLIIFFGAILISCEFEPDSENFIEIVPPDTTKTIRISLSPFETEYIFTVPTSVNYDLNTFGLTIYNVEFFIGKESIHSGNEAVGHFTFEPSPWGIGIETMTMVVTTNTNTGSLADLIGAEGMVFQQSWDILLDGGNPNEVEITNIFNDNGILKIEWEEYTRFNFQKYVLYKNFGGAEWEGEKHILAEITDAETHEFYDSSFVGGIGIYWIEVYASNQKAISQRKQFHHSYPQIDTTWIKGNSVQFNWAKHPFFKAVDKVTLTVPSYYYYPDSILFSSENENDTSCIVNGLSFGEQFNYTLGFHPNSELQIYQDNQILKSTISFGIGNTVPCYQKIICDKINNLAYFSNYEKIIQYDLVNKKQISTVESGFFYSWFISSYDKKLTTLLNSTMTIYNNQDLKDKQVYDSNDLGLYGFWNASISKDNKTLGPIGSGLGCYDWNQKKLIFTINNQTGASLSADGSYAFSNEQEGFNTQKKIIIYKVSDSGFQQIKVLTIEVESSIKWLPDTNKLLIIIGSAYNPFDSQNKKVQIYDIEKLAFETDFMVNPGKFCGVDTDLKQIAFFNYLKGIDDKQNLYLYNLETGKLEKTIKLAPRFDGLLFSNSYIFSGKGFCMKISELE